MPRPDLRRVPEWYHGYIHKTEGDDLLKLLEEQVTDFTAFMSGIPEEKRNYRYAEGKWSIRDLFQHILDAERIFAYRALRFARRDATPLPSFEENDYAMNAKAERREWNEMIEEFEFLRRANIILFRSFDEEALEMSGTASGKSIYVRGIGFVLVGHINHHVGIIKEIYLDAQTA